MAYQPSAIVSMQFFNNAVTSATTTQYGATSKTVFHDSNKNVIATAVTEQHGSTFNTEYFDQENNKIGTSTSEWAGTVISTSYHTANAKIGSSVTNWAGTEYNTEYLDLNKQSICRSYTVKNGVTSETQYNLANKPKPTTYTTSTNPSTTFAAKPATERNQNPRQKQGKCCSIM